MSGAAHPSGRPRVLVSVLNYNSVDDPVATLRSLRQLDYPNFHLQVVDNASATDCVARIREQVPGIDVRVLDRNLGYTGGNNHALRQGLAEGYDYVFVCNEDIELDPGALTRLVDTAEAHPDAGVVGAVEVCFFTGDVRAVGSDGFSLWSLRPRWVAELPAPGTGPFETGFVQGAAVLFTRRALEAGVLMDEDLFIYYDEIDVGLKTYGAGLKVYVDPAVVVRHKNRPKHMNARSAYLHQRNRVYMARRYGKWYHRLVLHARMALFELPAKVVVRSAQGHRRFARACVIGYLDGVAGRMGAGRVAEV